MGTIRLYLFGQLRVALHDRPERLSAPPRTGPLLAFLALHPVLRDRRSVAAALWPDLDPDKARANLRRHLHYLRKALSGPGAVSWLTTKGSRIGLDPDAPLWIDVRAFEQAGRSGDLETAVALYQGPLLPDFDDEWVALERERLRSDYLAHLMALAERYRSAGRVPEALAMLDRLLREEPFREDAVRTAMRLRFAGGDRAGALGVFEHFADALERELGVAPMHETRALFETIVREIPPPTTPAVNASVPAELPFVGRQRELAELEERWARARDRHGSFVLLGGPAGIGKTRLLRRLARSATADNGRALRGTTSDPEALPYEAFAAALHPVLPLLMAVGDRTTLRHRVLASALLGSSRSEQDAPLPELPLERERARLFHTVTRAVADLAATRPLLLVLEDVHSASEASVAQLEHLARRAATLPLLLVASYRDDVLDPDHPLRAMRRRLEADGLVRTMALTGLRDEDVVEALSRVALTGLGASAAPTLRSVSAGNPLLISELVHEAVSRGTAPATLDGGDRQVSEADWAELVPEGVRTRVTARLERLPADARTFAGAAAVVGDSFRLDTLCDVLGWSEREALDALDVLLDTHLVRERRLGSFAFRHQLMREAIYRNLDDTTRQRHHRRVAHTLGRATVWQPGAAELAHHFDRGGEPEQAAHAILVAAREALVAGASDEARTLVERGLDLTQEPSLRLALLQLAEDQARRQGDHQRQEDYLDAIDALAKALGDDDACFDALARRAVLLRGLGERDAEAAVLERLSTIARDDGRPERLARAALLRAQRAVASGYPDEAEQEIGIASTIATDIGDRRLRVASACLAAQAAMASGRVDRVLEHLDVAQQAGAYEQPELLVEALRAGLMAAIGREAYQDAFALSERLLGIATATGDRALEADAHQYRAVSLARLARLTEARAHFRVAERLYRELDRPQGLAAVTLNRSILDLRMGDHVAAAERLTVAAGLFSQLGDRRGETLCVLNGSSALLYGGRFQEARAKAERALELAEGIGNELLAATALSNLGDAERHLGIHDEAIRHLCEAVAIERRLERDASMANALCELALVYLAEDRLDDAGAVADDLLEVLERRERELLHPQQVAWVAARVQHALGHEVEARSLARAAADRLRSRIRVIEDDHARAAFEALEFNREISTSSETGTWP